MPELNVPQILIYFATFYGVTNVLYGINKKGLFATFNFLRVAFDNKDGEEIRQRRIEEEVRRRIGERRIQEEMRRIEEEEEEAEKTD